MKNILAYPLAGLCLLLFATTLVLGQSSAQASLELPAQLPVFEAPKRLSASINSDMEETLPVLAQDGKTLYFVRVLHTDNTGGRLSGHDIWYSVRNDDGSWQSPRNSMLSLNNKGNNAVLGFNQEGTRMYLMNQYGQGPSFTTGISYADASESSWGYPQQLETPKIRKEGFFYNVFISPDEQVMIVSMVQRDQKGDEDLYLAVREADGEWGKLQNMGSIINTPGFETYPFLSADKRTLYFSSNGHSGFGDADIFMTTRQDDSWTSWSKPVNMGKPVNSKGFDAGFVLYPDSTAFFASNRTGGMSDIYQTRIARPKPPKEEKPVLAFKEMTESEREEMEPTEEDNSMADLSDSRKEAIVVEDVYPLTVSIYFAFDSHELSPEAQVKLKELFQKYTNGDGIKVGLTGHTDAIGTEAYNQKLSIRRAQSAEDFLLKAGLAQERVNKEGKGEAEPAASNNTPEGRRQNRRVMIMVVK